MTLNKDTLREEIRKICTYYSELDEGTAGYDLTEEQFQKLFDLFDQREQEIVRLAEGIAQEYPYIEAMPFVNKLSDLISKMGNKEK